MSRRVLFSAISILLETHFHASQVGTIIEPIMGINPISWVTCLAIFFLKNFPVRILVHAEKWGKM
jgi:hypothetical protein